MVELRSKRIQLVIDLAQREQETAAEQFQQATGFCDMQRKKLNELKDYYAFYEQRSNSISTGIRATALIQSRAFLAQLHTAIDVQHQQLHLAEKKVLEARDLWHKHYLKLQSMQELQQRYQKEESSERDRREQKMLDDWVSQRAARTDSDRP